MSTCIHIFSFLEEDAYLGAFLLCIYLGLKLLINWVWIYLAFLDTANQFSNYLYIYSPRITFALYHCQLFKYSFLFHFSNSDGYVMVFHSDFNLHSDNCFLYSDQESRTLTRINLLILIIVYRFLLFYLYNRIRK